LHLSGAELSTKLTFIKIYKMIRRKRYILLLVLVLGATNLFAQNTELKTLTDSSWIEYVAPNFMNNITDYDEYISPHYKRFDFESEDKKIKINVVVNFSDKYIFKLKENYLADLKNKELKLEYKKLLPNKYFISGNLTNGNILYKFSYEKDGYGYTYEIEYDKSYTGFFNKNLNDIIKGFKILQ
jgi:hypothetical protein